MSERGTRGVFMGKHKYVKHMMEDHGCSQLEARSLLPMPSTRKMLRMRRGWRMRRGKRARTDAG